MSNESEECVKIKKSELEEIVDRKVKERIDTISNAEINQDNGQDGNISRRSFLKKLGVGAAGLGALSISPAASQLKITKNGISGDSRMLFGGSNSNIVRDNVGGFDAVRYQTSSSPPGVLHLRNAKLRSNNSKGSVYTDSKGYKFDKSSEPADAQWYDVLTVSTPSSGEVIVGMNDTSDGGGIDATGLVKTWWSKNGGVSIKTFVDSKVNGADGFSLQWNGNTLQIKGDTQYGNVFQFYYVSMGNDIDTWHL